MEIPEKGTMQFLFAQNQSAGTMAHPSGKSTDVQEATVERDTVSLTEKGRDVRTAFQNARLLPEIREDRVMRIKRQIEKGVYRVNGDQIAVSMIDESIENNNILKHIDTKA